MLLHLEGQSRWLAAEVIVDGERVVECRQVAIGEFDIDDGT
jgi:hypothetical protein